MRGSCSSFTTRTTASAASASALLAQDNAIAFQARLKAAITATGLDAGLKGRRLLVLREGPPPSGAKTAELVQSFLDAGGLLLAPAAEDFALFAALHELSRAAGFEAWLRRRKPLYEAKLFQAAGLAPPDFLAAEPPPSARTRAGPAAETRAAAARRRRCAAARAFGAA